jgi:hypothetical protein
MFSSSREDIEEVFDLLLAVVSRACGLSFDALTTPERLTYLERLEQEARRLPVPAYELINQVARQATRDEIGGKLSHVLADRLRITRAQAARRIDVINGVPIHALAASAGINVGDIWGIDSSRVFAAIREGVTLATSSELWFDYDSIAIRATTRLSFAFPDPMATVLVSGGGS